jgi:Xaa-Pro aminopeptidase
MMELEPRIQQVRDRFSEKGIDAMLVSQPENLYYLSFCEGLEGYILVTSEQVLLVTDFRYIEQAERQSSHCEVFQIKGKMSEWFPSLFSRYKIKRLAFESSHLTFAAHERMNGIIKDAGLDLEMVPVSDLIESVRIIKDREELGQIIEAARITGAALNYVEEILRPGVTEKELAWQIERYMRDNGSQPVPFDLIVAAGPNAALPHAKPSDYVIREGEPVIVDIGSKRNYYVSDMTRTFCVGTPDETYRKVYHTVLQAQETALSKIKSGISGAEADALARSVIAGAGYGQTFGHSLGHGIGLITHENPRLGPDSTDILRNGMVFTVEPGIYISGWGGVRIEDDAVIENGQIRTISSAKK